jgi:class 3 adenylate cyclase
MSTSTLPTGTVTLLAADIDESSICPTEARQIEAVRARLVWALTELVDAHYGICLGEQGAGGGFVVTFAGAGDAVSCAMALHRAAPPPVLLRIGVHTGEIAFSAEEERLGGAIDKAARLRDLAVGGQTLLTGTTSELVCDALPPDASLIDLDRHRLRAIPRPERISELRHDRHPSRLHVAPVRPTCGCAGSSARVLTITPRSVTRC